ncbi:MAG TPA: pyridoxamine 5'-phosphate oxidase family protein [Planctomycetota bacterium]|nr:pyridoxamine 5'-phosphate oxidase family protein [Planctomycetota bacterium]
MTKPIPQPVDPTKVPSLALEVVKTDHAPLLATMDGDQPRLRPVSLLKIDGFTVYVGNLRRYHKTLEIQANPKVEMCFMDGDHNQVRVTGLAEVVTDRPTLEEIWNSNPLLRSFMRTMDNPEFILYRISPKRVRYMQEWALEYHDVALP